MNSPSAASFGFAAFSLGFTKDPSGEDNFLTGVLIARPETVRDKKLQQNPISPCTIL